MQEIPILQPNEETEFDFGIQNLGSGLVKGSIEDFRKWSPRLQQNPNLEFRVQVDGAWATIFVRSQDWEKVCKKKWQIERKAARKKTWASMATNVILAL